MSSNAVGIGILGFGGFAMFAAQSVRASARGRVTVYGDLLRAMLTDQLAFIAKPSHTRASSRLVSLEIRLP